MNENYVERISAVKSELVEHISKKIDEKNDYFCEAYDEYEFKVHIPSKTYEDREHHNTKLIFAFWYDVNGDMFIKLGDNLEVRLSSLCIEDIAAIADQLDEDAFFQIDCPDNEKEKENE